MLMDISSSKFDIYRGTVASNCFKIAQTLDVLISFHRLMPGLKFTLSDVTSFSAEQSARVLKKVISRLDVKPTWNIFNAKHTYHGAEVNLKWTIKSLKPKCHITHGVQDFTPAQFSRLHSMQV